MLIAELRGIEKRLSPKELSQLKVLFISVDPESDDPIARESTRLQCAAVIGAQTSLDPKQMKAWTPNSKYGGHAFGKSNFAQFLAERDSILPWIAEYSPYALVSPGDPPVSLTYSVPPAIGKNQKDPTHTSNFGVKLQEHCTANKVACELVYLSASCAAQRDLAPTFVGQWRLPLTKEARETLAKTDWKAPGLQAGEVLKSLPKKTGAEPAE